eukprot:5990245-Prymnesium_polylepis.2
MRTCIALNEGRGADRWYVCPGTTLAARAAARAADLRVESPDGCRINNSTEGSVLRKGMCFQGWVRGNRICVARYGRQQMCCWCCPPRSNGLQCTDRCTHGSSVPARLRSGQQRKGRAPWLPTSTPDQAGRRCIPPASQGRCHWKRFPPDTALAWSSPRCRRTRSSMLGTRLLLQHSDTSRARSLRTSPDLWPPQMCPPSRPTGC